MANSGLEIKGLKETNRALKQLDKKVAGRIARGGTAKMAQVLRKEMRSRAPSRTGEGKKNIRYKIKKLPGGVGFRGWVGPFSEAFYFRFIEKGAAPHFIPYQGRGRNRGKARQRKPVAFDGKVFTRVEHPGVRPQPFIRPAYEAKKREAVQEAEKRIRLMIAKEARKK
ncbi:HK97-gp10 family putative phage morphogenesis protein [Alloalcanivorax sp. C16-1]|uniref:HK97-gp10 family putative phage morphogenesis protein n=1 Tax=Alloalcanivorax sp. C16-1 TaxID=3390051 RepID=UPI00397097B4